MKTPSSRSPNQLHKLTAPNPGQYPSYMEALDPLHSKKATTRRFELDSDHEGEGQPRDAETTRSSPLC